MTQMLSSAEVALSRGESNVGVRNFGRHRKASFPKNKQAFRVLTSVSREADIPLAGNLADGAIVGFFDSPYGEGFLWFRVGF